MRGLTPEQKPPETICQGTCALMNVMEMRGGPAIMRLAHEGLTMVLAALMFLSLFALPALAGDEATMKASLEKGYARMVLTFKDRFTLPKYEVNLASGILIVSFKSKVVTDVSDVPTKLAKYISIAKRDPDGFDLRFALRQEVRINTIAAGEMLFVDLLPANWQGLPPGLPQAVIDKLAARAAEAAKKLQAQTEKNKDSGVDPIMEFSVGEAPTLTRLAFTWNVPFEVEVRREKGALGLRFNHDAPVDFSLLRSNMPRNLKAIVDKHDNGRLSILMSLSSKADVRAFRDGKAYIVDIYGIRTPQGRSKTKSVLEKALQGFGTVATSTEKFTSPGKRDDKAVAVPKPANQTSQTPTKPVVTPGTVQEDPKVTDPQSGLPVMPDISPPKKPRGQGQSAAPKAQVNPDQQNRKTTKAPQTKQAPAAVPASFTPGGATQPAPVPGTKTPAAGQPGIKRPVAGQNAAEMPAAALQMKAGQGKSVSVGVEKVGRAFKLTFPFRKKVTSAVFQRLNVLWLVFDSSQAINVSGLKDKLGPLVSSLRHLDRGQFQIVRIQMVEPRLATLTSEDTAWMVMIGDELLEPTQPLKYERGAWDDGRAYVKTTLSGAGHVRRLKDPQVGDTLMVVTASGPPRGFLKRRSFVEFDTLPSSHGIAIRPLSDDLTVRIDGNDVVVVRRRGLTVSSGRAQLYDPVLNSDGRQGRPGYLEFERWRAPDPGAYGPLHRGYVRHVIDADKLERAAKRLDLASFYIANGLGAEALGMLQLAGEDDTKVLGNPDFLVLRSLGNLQMGRTKEALKDLKDRRLKSSPDAAMWRTIAAAEGMRWKDGVASAPTGETVLLEYPHDVQARFRLGATEAYMMTGDYTEAAAHLAQVSTKGLPDWYVAKYAYLRGLLADKAGRTDEALKILANVQKMDVRQFNVAAKLRELDIKARQKTIKSKDLAEELEKLALIWRGDDIERRTLRLLGRTHAKMGNYRRAFEVMKSAVKAYGDSDIIRRFQNEMRTVFNDLFLRKRADDLEPIEALSLYYDFREMTPIGRKGDEMIRQLADRLVSVDLLDKASELLSHQVDNRLQGSARAQVATDLALVYLMDYKPAYALRVLHRTRQARLPKELGRKRRIIEARALSELGRSKAALELLSALKGAEVERLRADTYWKAKEWGAAAEQLESMHGSLWSSAEPLSDVQRSDILRAAIGYSMANDQIGIDRLRQKYAVKMSEGPDASAFEIVTKPLSLQGMQAKELARSVSAINTLDAFVKDYRARYAPGKETAKGAGAVDQKKQPEPQAKAGGATPEPQQTAAAQ